METADEQGSSNGISGLLHVVYAYLDATMPILEGPYSRHRVKVISGHQCDLCPLIYIMAACRFSRLLSLEYWHAQVKAKEVEHFQPDTDREMAMERRRNEILGVVEECLEQVRHAMRVDELKVRA